MNNTHPKDSFEITKIKMMKDTIKELLETNNLEICGKTTFNRKDEEGIEYTTTGFCMMPLFQTEEFDGHFEFRRIQEVYEPDATMYDIRFYNNSILDGDPVKLFKAVFVTDKYDEEELDYELYSLFDRINEVYLMIVDELAELDTLMKGIMRVNKNKEGIKVGDLHHENLPPNRPPQQNGGPKPPYKPIYQIRPPKPSWFVEKRDSNCVDGDEID